MKKLLIVCAALLGYIALGQDHEGRVNYSEMTPEQIATLGSKRLALALDLSQEQQARVMDLQLQRINERRALMKDRKNKGKAKAIQNPDDRFNRLNSKLDRQLAYKSEMKGILTEAQFQKWEVLHSKKYRHTHHKRHQHRRSAKR